MKILLLVESQPTEMYFFYISSLLFPSETNEFSLPFSFFPSLARNESAFLLPFFACPKKTGGPAPPPG